MTLTILCIIVIIFFVLVIGYFIDGMLTAGDGKVKEADKKANISCIFLGLTVFSTVFLIYASSHFDNMPYTYSNTSYLTEYIAALKDNSEVNGQFHGGRYCTRGYINEVQYYSYMVKHSDGGKVINKVPVNGATIYEANDNFRVEWYHKTKKWLGMTDEENYWKIYVPVGSITEDYDVDLE